MESEIFKAIEEQCSIDTWQKFISDVENVNLKNHSGETALHVVIRKWSDKPKIVQAVQLLIDAGADVNLENGNGLSVIEALLRSNCRGQKLFEISEILIKAGGDVNSTQEDGLTLLHLAASDFCNQIDFIRFLLQRGVKVDSQDHDGFTTLHSAVQLQNKDIIQCLIDAGSDINRMTPNGLTPLHLAADAVNVDLIKYLITRGADVNAKNRKTGWTPLHSLMFASNRELKKKELLSARSLAQADALEVLLSANANVNAVELADGNTPLHNFIDSKHNGCSYKYISIDFETFESFLKIIKIFIKHGADFKIKNRHGLTPIDIFLHNYEIDENTTYAIVLLEPLIKYRLIDADSLFSMRRPSGRTILHDSCENTNLEMIKFLVNYGANIEVVDENSETPLIWLIRFLIPDDDPYYPPYGKILDYFLSLNPDVNVISNDGMNFLNIIFLDSNDDHILPYPEFLWKALIEFTTKKQSTGYLLHDTILQTISKKRRYRRHLDKCAQELKSLQEVKLSSNLVNLRDILMDHKKKLVRYAKNKELVQEFNELLLVQKYPIFGRYINKRFLKAIKKREIEEKSAVILSSCLPNHLDPSHLVISKIIGYLKGKYLRYLCEPESEDLKRKIKWDKFKMSFDKFVGSYRV